MLLLAGAGLIADYRETAYMQIKELGFNPQDVRHILVTHLDLDHAGGLSDFPEAKVHIFAPEFEAAMNPNWRENNATNNISGRMVLTGLPIKHKAKNGKVLTVFVLFQNYKMKFY
jgi:glyoxylase-like metal-dependent hydrolase (beta-lactamase superfamily II)